MNTVCYIDSYNVVHTSIILHLLIAAFSSHVKSSSAFFTHKRILSHVEKMILI
jgi:hypothetical protein